MTISAANYLNGTYQTQTDSLKKTGQSEDAPETGKTRQSAVSASLDQVNLGEDGIAVTEVSRQQGTEQTAARSAQPRMDRVEISGEGKAACAKLQMQKAASSSDSETENSVEDLSQYTNAELKQMYRRGEITCQQYEKQTGETLE